MRRYLTAILAGLVGLGLLLGCGPAGAAERVYPLRIHAWVGYFPAWLLRDFTEETGIHVVQSFFADNAALYRALVDTGGSRPYDLITPSSEMTQRLVGENLLLPVDKKAAPRAASVDPWFGGMAHDPGGRYSVPLFWGVLGLCIDTAVLPPEVALRVKGYGDLWLPELKGLILLPNDFRSIMSIMLLTLGYSVNDGNARHLEAAYALLETLAPSVRTYDTVDQAESMEAGDTGVGVVWAGAAYLAGGPSNRLRFVFPSEGSPTWIDAMAVPVNAPRPREAFLFIDYVLRPEVLARLARETGWSVTVPGARALLARDIRDSPVLYPPMELRRSFEPELQLPPEALVLEKRWHKLKLGLGR